MAGNRVTYDVLEEEEPREVELAPGVIIKFKTGNKVFHVQTIDSELHIYKSVDHASLPDSGSGWEVKEAMGISVRPVNETTVILK